ncbi:MAG: transporter substrate-binding protein [Clostridiales bacterium]|nr:transporter substrate-binding protein [Clostridiales bacterium]
MKKRILALLLGATMVVSSLVGCTKADEAATTGETAASSETEDTGKSTASDGDTIKLGVLFSSSGSTSTLEDVCANVVQMVVDETNEAGGINGKQIEIVREDYNSDPTVAVEKMKKLILQDGVVATIGTYASASRNSVKPVVEENDSLLYYPTSYEGETPSDNIVYMGAVSQQQWEYLIPWLKENYGEKMFFVYTDTTGAKLMTEQAADVCEEIGGTVVGEEAVPAGQTDFSTIITKMKQAEPDVIVSGLWADSETAMYKQFENYGMSMKDTPVAGVQADENVFKAAGSVAEGAILCASYENTIENDANTAWKEAYYSKYDDSYEMTALSESTYIGTYYLIEALKKITDGDYSTENILKNMEGITMDAPEGEIEYNAATHHFNMKYKIGIVNAEGKLDVVDTSDLIVQDPASSAE